MEFNDELIIVYVNDHNIVVHQHFSQTWLTQDIIVHAWKLKPKTIPLKYKSIYWEFSWNLSDLLITYTDEVAGKKLVNLI